MMKYIYIISLLFLFTCEESKTINPIKTEISKIEVDISVDELQSRYFENFHVEWDNYFLYEPDCGQYDLVPRLDTFKNSYLLDFCASKYMYFDSYAKKKSEISNVRIFNRKEGMYLNLAGNNRFDDIIRHEVDFYLFSDTITVFHPIHYFEVIYLKNVNNSKRVFGVNYGEIRKEDLLELVKSGLVKGEDNEAELLNKVSIQIIKNDTNSIAFFTDYSFAMINNAITLEELIIDDISKFLNRATPGDKIIINDLSFVFNNKTEHIDEYIEFNVISAN